jgi:hypothetical protein
MPPTLSVPCEVYDLKTPPLYVSGFVRLASPGWCRMFKWVHLGGYWIPIGASDFYNPQQSFIQSMILPVVENAVGMVSAFLTGGAAIAVWSVGFLATSSGVIKTPTGNALLKVFEKEAQQLAT